MNFLKETLKVLDDLQMESDDILFIGSADGKYGCTWEEFNKLADFEYHEGFGGQEIPSDIVIVFDDRSYLTRYEYDGSESWQYNKVLTVPEIYFKINNFQCLEDNDSHMSWQTIADRQL